MGIAIFSIVALVIIVFAVRTNGRNTSSRDPQDMSGAVPGEDSHKRFPNDREG